MKFKTSIYNYKLGLIMKNLFYDIFEYIDDNIKTKHEESNENSIEIYLNNGIEIKCRENLKNERIKSSNRFNVSYRATHKNS